MLNSKENISNSIRKKEAVRCFSNIKLLNKSFSDLLSTDFSEKNAEYSILAAKSYTYAIHILKNMQDMLLVSEQKSMKDIANRKNIQLIDKKPRVLYLNDVIKVEIPMFLLKQIKKKAEIDSVVTAVDLAIDDFFVNIGGKSHKIDDFQTCTYAIVENYVIPEGYHIDIDRIDFSPVRDLLSIRFCSGFDDSRRLKTNLKTVKNHRDDFYVCLYLVRMEDLPSKLDWLMNDY